ncbi:GIY-YIG nuclease family protein [Roseovarius sp. D0-M9]|uniref:GIY-YIG nuclease family protein n=1 Tax=Roseovarius sp. D0-M9 TaxID=3127117 RepID=UPI0030101BA2
MKNLIHRIFGKAQLDIQIPDQFGRSTSPREWFLVPLLVIDDVVEKIRDGTITRYEYGPEKAKLVVCTSGN